MRKIKSLLFFIGVLALWYACSRIVDYVPNESTKSSASFSSLAFTTPDAWYTIGHDAQRTSASNGTITALTYQWRYVPSLGSATTYKSGAGNCVADQNNIWYKYEKYAGQDASAIDRVTLSGTTSWSNQGYAGNFSQHTWLMKLGNYVYFNDDFLTKTDISTGSQVDGRGFDLWGEMLPKPDGTKYFSGNNLYLDAIGTWLNASTPNGSINLGTDTLWTKYSSSPLKGFKDVNRMALAYENDTLFFAPNFYQNGASSGSESGVYAYKEDGTLIWFKSAHPNSAISCANRLVYSVEGDSIVARNKTNGNVNWYQTFTGYIFNGQPPVLADSKVLITTSTGVWTYNQVTGTPGWNKPFGDIVKPAGTYSDLVFFYDQNRRENTSMAAATGSNTLVLTSATGLYLLSLTDGSETAFIHSRNLVRGYFVYGGDTVWNRTCNPVIVGNRVYVTEANPIFMNIPIISLICVADGGSPPAPDTEAPTAPSGLALSSVTSSSMTLTWNASTDNVGVSYYNVFYRQSGGTWQSATNSSLSKSFTGLAFATTYEFYVNAVDGAGNTSSNSGTSSQATLSPEPPTPSATLMGSIAPGTLNVHLFNWSSSGATTQVLQRKSKGAAYATIFTWATGTPQTYSYIQPSTNTTYTYKILVNGTYSSNEVSLKSRRR